MRLGFTGSREGMTYKQRYAAIKLITDLNPDWGGHGDCVGADTDFHRICIAQSIPIHIFPSWLKSRAHNSDFNICDPEKGPLERDRDIVHWCDKLLATPKAAEELRSGAWTTIRYAKKIAKLIYIVMPDGSLV